MSALNETPLESSDGGYETDVARLKELSSAAKADKFVRVVMLPVDLGVGVVKGGTNSYAKTSKRMDGTTEKVGLDKEGVDDFVGSLLGVKLTSDKEREQTRAKRNAASKKREDEITEKSNAKLQKKLAKVELKAAKKAVKSQSITFTVEPIVKPDPIKIPTESIDNEYDSSFFSY